METKKIIPILIVVIVIVLIMIAYKTADRVIEDKKKGTKGLEDDIGTNEQELPQLKSTSESAGEAESSGGAGGGTGSIENQTLPSDINAKPCSFYFLEYGICAGTCPAGTCQHIGKSCYCVLS